MRFERKLLSVLLASLAAAPLALAAELPAATPLDDQDTDESGFVTRALDYSVSLTGEALVITVSGLVDTDLLALRFNGVDISAAVIRVGEEGTPAIESSDGELRITLYPGVAETLWGAGTLSLAFASGAVLSLPVEFTPMGAAPAAEVQKASCSWLTFSRPTTVAENKRCLYGSMDCA